MEQLPADSLICKARAILGFIAKALAAFKITNVNDYSQLFFNGTKRRGTPIKNIIIGYQADVKY